MKKQVKNTVKCPFCGYIFIPKESDIEYVDQIPTYWCRNEKCQENFIEDIKIGHDYVKNNKEEWK